MRSLALLLLLLSPLALAKPPAPADLQAVFTLAGVGALCEQTRPLLLRGLPEPAASRLGKQEFSSEALCRALAAKVAAGYDQQQLERARTLLSSPLAQRFSAAEKAVGDEPQAFEAYRKQLAERPPRGARVELVKALDEAAHTTDLAHLLRYEIGKTQAWLVLAEHGESITEAELSERTAKESEALRSSSQQGIETFMLFAYRRIPSEQISEYRALYQDEAVANLLRRTVEAIPQVFAERRAALR